MRFDTAVNCMVLDLFKNNKISVKGKSNKRPFIHVKDVVQAYLLTITAEQNKIAGQIFNVGSEDQNYEMGDLANEIAKIIANETNSGGGGNKFSAQVGIKDINSFENFLQNSKSILESKLK